MTISINPSLALRLDPIEGGIQVKSFDDHVLMGTDVATLGKELHAVLSAEVSQYLDLENPGPPKPMFTDGGPGPLTMLLSLSVVEDGNLEVLLTGREDEQGGYLGVGFRGTVDEHERLDAWLQMVSRQYVGMVLGGAQ